IGIIHRGTRHVARLSRCVPAFVEIDVAALRMPEDLHHAGVHHDNRDGTRLRLRSRTIAARDRLADNVASPSSHEGGCCEASTTSATSAAPTANSEERQA